ncbi:Uncharacterised protein [Vibrio cholerae]|nr:Uncharacterised protein [Vibrio cholerae]
MPTKDSTTCRRENRNPSLAKSWLLNSKGPEISSELGAGSVFVNQIPAPPSAKIKPNNLFFIKMSLIKML